MSEFTRLLQAREQFDSESEFARLKAMSWQQESSGGALVKPPSRVRVRALRKRYKAMRMGHIIKCMDGSANHGKPGPCPKPKAPKPQASSRPQAAPEPVSASSHSHSSEPQAAPVTTKDSWKGVKKVAIALGITAAAVGVGVLAYKWKVKNPEAYAAIWDKLKSMAQTVDDVANISAKVSAASATAVAVANRLKQDDLVDPDNGVPEKVTRQLAQDMGDEVRYRYATEEIKKALAAGRDPHPESVQYLAMMREKARKGIEDGTISPQKVERALKKVDVTIAYDDLMNHLESMSTRPTGERAYMDTISKEPLDDRIAYIQQQAKEAGIPAGDWMKWYSRRVAYAFLAERDKAPQGESEPKDTTGVDDLLKRYIDIESGDLPRGKGSDEAEKNDKFMRGGFESAILNRIRMNSVSPDSLTTALINTSKEKHGSLKFSEFYDILMNRPRTPADKNVLRRTTSARSRSSEQDKA